MRRILIRFFLYFALLVTTSVWAMEDDQDIPLQTFVDHSETDGLTLGDIKSKWEQCFLVSKIDLSETYFSDFSIATFSTIPAFFGTVATALSCKNYFQPDNAYASNVTGTYNQTDLSSSFYCPLSIANNVLPFVFLGISATKYSVQKLQNSWADSRNKENLEWLNDLSRRRAPDFELSDADMAKLKTMGELKISIFRFPEFLEKLNLRQALILFEVDQAQFIAASKRNLFSASVQRNVKTFLKMIHMKPRKLIAEIRKEEIIALFKEKPSIFQALLRALPPDSSDKVLSAFKEMFYLFVPGNTSSAEGLFNEIRNKERSIYQL